MYCCFIISTPMIAHLPYPNELKHKLLSLTDTSEQVLVEALRKAELPAFNFLYHKYAANLFGVVFKIVNQQETAEDLLQEVFLKIRRNFHSYDERKARLFTWMLNIARNTAIDHLRLRVSRQERTHVAFEQAGVSLDEYTHSFNIDTIGIKNILNQLSPKHSQMLDLFYYKGYTHPEISELLGLPLGSVKTSIRQAILALRVIFEVRLAG